MPSPKNSKIFAWNNLRKPFFILAPMADVTDSAFRQIIAKYGRPDVFFTEFVSCAGLCSPNQAKVAKTLAFTKTERPIVAQLWGNDPKQFYICARLVRKLGFDGIDINMGCPDKAVVKQGGGAALIKEPKLARRIIIETIRGAGPLPVSVKTRIGYLKNELAGWLPVLLRTKIAALTIHARTKKEMSKVPADWSTIAQAVKIRDRLKSPILVIGNGDVQSLAEARQRAEETGCDGVMVGRSVFGQPWFFNPRMKPESITAKKRLAALIKHARIFENLYSGDKPFDLMKKHVKAYVSGFKDAKSLRLRLMQTKNARQLSQIIKTADINNKE